MPRGGRRGVKPPATAPISPVTRFVKVHGRDTFLPLEIGYRQDGNRLYRSLAGKRMAELWLSPLRVSVPDISISHFTLNVKRFGESVGNWE